MPATITDLDVALKLVEEGQHAIKIALAHTEDPHAAYEALMRVKRHEREAAHITNMAGDLIDRMAREMKEDQQMGSGENWRQRLGIQ